MLNDILVFLGAGAGGVSRSWASGCIANRYGCSPVLCLMAVWLGHVLAKVLNSTKGV